MSDPALLLIDAVQAIQSGQREKARQLLIELVDQEPDNAEAWVYLSDLVDNIEDRLIAIENALLLLPGDGDLLAQRDAHLQAYPHLKDPGQDTQYTQTVLRARQLAGENRFIEAVALLRTLTAQYTHYEEPWLALARWEPGLQERARAASKALEINPQSKEARDLLEEVQKERKNPFLRGQHFEEQGEMERAMEVYLAISVHSRLATERFEAQRRMESIRTRQEAHAIQPVHPNLNLGRLATGPVLLFILFLFLQSGLKLSHLPWLALPGILSVCGGSLLVALTEMVPAHPRWVAWFGQPGSGDEPDWRRGLRLLGWGLMLAPYTIFLIEAGSRLGVLQSTLMSGMR